MEKYPEILKSVALFRGIKEDDLAALLSCLSTKVIHFEKNRSIFMSGARIRSFGIVLSGQVQIVKEDFYGNKSIISNIGEGNLFGEAFACAATGTIPVSVIATMESDILMIDSNRIINSCTKACHFHSKLIGNLLNIMALKNIALIQKIEFITKRTTRDKLLAYLSAEALKAKSNHFTIPFNRQELADFLSVDRSAMSAELSKLRDEGFLNFNKNEFELL